MPLMRAFASSLHQAWTVWASCKVPNEWVHSVAKFNCHTFKGAAHVGERNPNMEARALIESASYRPEVLKAMGQAFDEAWVQIAGNFGDDTIDAEKARLRLARALLSIAHKESCDVAVLKRAALERMALDYRTLGSR